MRSFITFISKKIKTHNGFLYSSPRTFSAGLTFIELIVVISIFSIMASIVLFNFNTFNTSLTSQNLAQEIALQIKKAQSDSISGKSRVQFLQDPITNPDKAPTYGVYFNIDPSNTMEVDGSSFVSFADINADHLYTKYGSGCSYSTTSTECMSLNSINSSDRIIGLCVDVGCKEHFFVPINDLTITFKRPFPDATIRTSIDNINHSMAGVLVQSARGAVRFITVNTLGEISVYDSFDTGLSQVLGPLSPITNSN